MRKPRLRISAMMIFVAVVAVDLAVAPAFLGYPRLGAGVIGVALQVACYLLVRGRGRAFWMGFLVAGSLSLASCFLAFPPHGTRLVRTTTAGVTTIRGVHDYPGSLMWQAWASYDRLWEPAGRYLAPYIPDAERSPMIYFGLWAVIALIESLPHWLVALAGGLVSYAATRRFRRADRLPVVDPPTPVAESPRDAAAYREFGPTMV